jgi:hypothetical protein
MIEKTRVVKIDKTPEEVKAIFEKAIREEDESVVFPAEYQVSLVVPDDDGGTGFADWPSISITLEIPEPRKPGRPKGSKKKDMGGAVNMDATASGQVA